MRNDSVGVQAANGNGLSGLNERVRRGGVVSAASTALSKRARFVRAVGGCASGSTPSFHFAVTIRLVLANDQELVRSTLCELLELQPDFEIVASVGRGDEVVGAAVARDADVALLDIEMPGDDGLAAAGALATQAAECRGTILTTFGCAGLPAPGNGSGRRRLRREGRPSRSLGRCNPARHAGGACRRPGARGPRPCGGGLAVHRSRARSALCGTSEGKRGRDCRQALYFARHFPELPVERDRQDCSA